MWQLRERQTMGIVQSIFLFLRAFIIGRATVAFENLALRQQVAAFKHSAKRPKLRRRDRIFWVLLSRFWPHWRSALAIVQPETVIKWQRMGFKLYWRWKSRAGKPGRPIIEREIRDLICRMSCENPTWGAPRLVAIIKCLVQRGPPTMVSQPSCMEQLSLPKTPSALACKDLRRLGKWRLHVSIANFKGQGRSESGISVTGLGRLRRQPFAHADTSQ